MTSFVVVYMVMPSFGMRLRTTLLQLPRQQRAMRLPVLGLLQLLLRLLPLLLELLLLLLLLLLPLLLLLQLRCRPDDLRAFVGWCWRSHAERQC